MNRFILLLWGAVVFLFPPSLLSQQIEITGNGPVGSYSFEMVDLPALQAIEGLETPFYHTFWEYGDGYFGFGSPQTHIYTEYLILDPYKVKGTSYPVYTNSDVPPIMDKNHSPGGNSTDPPPELLIEEEGGVDIEGSWNGSIRPEDPLTVVLLYEAIPDGIGSASGPIPNVDMRKGDISLLYDSDVIELVDDGSSARRYFKESVINKPISFGSTSNYNNNLSWAFDNLEGERSIFVTIRVKKNFPKDKSTVFLKVLVDYGNGAEIADSMSLPISTVLDPNSIQLSPNEVPESGPPVTLEGYIRFSNVASGIVNNIKIDWPMHDALDLATLNILDSDAGTNSTFSQQEIGNGARFVATNAGLAGAESPGLVDLGATFGHIHFTIDTKPDSYVGHDKITAQAQIVFDNMPPVPTNIEEVFIVTPPDLTVAGEETEETDDKCNTVSWIVVLILLLLLTIFVILLLREESKS